jgi:hypothetical protein
MIDCHCYYGPYQARLPWLVVALLMYIHKFVFIAVGEVIFGIVGAGWFLGTVADCTFV